MSEKVACRKLFFSIQIITINCPENRVLQMVPIVIWIDIGKVLGKKSIFKTSKKEI